MRIFLSLILLISFKSFAFCEFKPQVSKVVSLSGSTTVLFKELNLLNHKKLVGISIFNPVLAEEFPGKIYPGGIFLSREALTQMKGSLVFYDEGRELNKMFRSISGIEGEEIKTRNLTPSEALIATIKVVSNYLSGCEDRIQKLKEKMRALEKELLERIPSGLSVVFYLGEFRSGRVPEMVMANDGVVKWLREKKKIQTYPSSLPYVNWSSKLMGLLPENTLHVAIKDSGRSGEKEIKRSSQKMTLIYPGSLVPGLTQMEALLYWARSL